MNMKIDESKKESVDSVLAFIMMKNLITPIKDTESYKLGLVDASGKIIKQPETEEEKNALTMFDRFIFKIKNLLGGRIARLNNFVYLQTLDNDFYKDLVIKGALERRADVKRVSRDIKKVFEKHNIKEEDYYKAFIREYVDFEKGE